MHPPSEVNSMVQVSSMFLLNVKVSLPWGRRPLKGYITVREGMCKSKYKSSVKRVLLTACTTIGHHMFL